MSKHCFLRRHPGEGTPMILAIVLVLLMLFCTVAEFSRVWIIAQGVKEAAQQAVISTINDNLPGLCMGEMTPEQFAKIVDDALANN